MQDSRRASTNENKQQARPDRSSAEENSSLEPIKIDQQEGNMNHGNVGGNLGEDMPTKHHESAGSGQNDDHFSPPY